MQLDYALRQVRIRDILISEKGKIPRGSVSFGKTARKVSIFGKACDTYNPGRRRICRCALRPDG